MGKTNFLVHSLASRFLLLQKQDTSFQFTGGLIPQDPKTGTTEQLSKAPLNICGSSWAPCPNPWSWEEIRSSVRNGEAAKLIAVVCLYHGFQAGAGLQGISKAAHLLLLTWPIQHFCALFRGILNDPVEGVYKNDLSFIYQYIATDLVKLLLAFDY